MRKNLILAVAISFVFFIGFVFGAGTLGAVVLGSFMSPENPASPTVTVSCEARVAKVKFEVSEAQSLNWNKFKMINSTDTSSYSQTPLSTTSVATFPVQPGIYTLVTRQIVDFDHDAFPENSHLMAFRVITVPDCGE